MLFQESGKRGYARVSSTSYGFESGGNEHPQTLLRGPNIGTISVEGSLATSFKMTTAHIFDAAILLLGF